MENWTTADVMTIFFALHMILRGNLCLKIKDRDISGRSGGGLEGACSNFFFRGRSGGSNLRNYFAAIPLHECISNLYKSTIKMETQERA